MSVMCSIQTEKLVRPTLLADDPCTAEQMRKYILRCSELMGIGYKQLVNRAKKLVVQILTDRQSREEDQRRTRRTRERAASCPSQTRSTRLFDTIRISIVPWLENSQNSSSFSGCSLASRFRRPSGSRWTITGLRRAEPRWT